MPINRTYEAVYCVSQPAAEYKIIIRVSDTNKLAADSDVLD